MMRGAIATLICCALLGGAWAAKPLREPPPTAPRRAVGDFTSSNYAITFKAPDYTYYCPLPDGWEGSDHGTILFLASPSACYGAGYPSSVADLNPAMCPASKSTMVTISIPLKMSLSHRPAARLVLLCCWTEMPHCAGKRKIGLRSSQPRGATWLISQPSSR